MAPMFYFLARLFARRKSPDVRFWSGRFITQVWTNRDGHRHPVDRVSFRRPLRGRSVNEFWHDEMDDLALAVGQANEWIGFGIKPVDRKHVSQRGRRPHWKVRKRGMRWVGTCQVSNVLVRVRPFRSVWTGRLRYKATFNALYEGGGRGVTFPQEHLCALECAADVVRQLVYGGQEKLPETVGEFHSKSSAPVTNGKAHA